MDAVDFILEQRQEWDFYDAERGELSWDKVMAAVVCGTFSLGESLLLIQRCMQIAGEPDFGRFGLQEQLWNLGRAADENA